MLVCEGFADDAAAGFVAEGAIGCFGRGGDHLHAFGDGDEGGDALVQRRDEVAGQEGAAVPLGAEALGARVVEDADYGGVATGEDARDAAGAPAIAAWWGFVDEDLIALHGAVDFVGGDENIVGFTVAGLSVRADEAEAVTVEVETSGDEAVAAGTLAWFSRFVCARGLGGRRCGDGPTLFAVDNELFGGDKAGELVDEETALAPTAQTQLADKLLVARALCGGARDACE